MCFVFKIRVAVQVTESKLKVPCEKVMRFVMIPVPWGIIFALDGTLRTPSLHK